MCGLAGVLSFRGEMAELQAAVGGMCDSIRHRGPDSSGVWCDADAGIGLGHRRLAILELTSAGAQPMVSASARLVITFNGEIYNHLELRAQLAKTDWRGHSDTETLLAAIEAWGIAKTLERVVGMFAFALWDRDQRELTLARDRVGEKPMYYGWNKDVLLFASECKALTSYPAWQGELDRDTLASYMRTGYCPTPKSIWRGICKLPPGTTATFRRDLRPSDLPHPVPYWRAAEIAPNMVRTGLRDAEAVAELESRLKQVIAGQMVADVPVGSFLSGGVDSSAVTALMQAQSAQPVRTFSIGFTETDYDEAIHASAVAAHLGTDHTECLLTPRDVLSVVPSLPDIYDEPFGDSSQIPTHLVARIARRQVAVSLSGDGGDELFGGYNRYTIGARFWRRAKHVPPGIRRAGATAIQMIGPTAWDRLGRSLPRRFRQPTFGDRLHKLAGIMDAADTSDLYRRFIRQQHESESIVFGAYDGITWAGEEADAYATKRRSAEIADHMMFSDLVGYLTDDILVKVDRAAMAVGLESRVPMLDHRLIEFVWSLKPDQKIRAGMGKWLLRQVLYRYVPARLIERPKQGFGVPIDSWLRHELRDWAEALLDEKRLRQEGLLDWRLVRERWYEHLAGRRNRQHWLWNVLMFQAWRERWL